MLIFFFLSYQTLSKVLDSCFTILAAFVRIFLCSPVASSLPFPLVQNPCFVLYLVGHTGLISISQRWLQSTWIWPTSRILWCVCSFFWNLGMKIIQSLLAMPYLGKTRQWFNALFVLYASSHKELEFCYSCPKPIFFLFHVFLQSARLTDAFWRYSCLLSDCWIESFLLCSRHIARATLLSASAVSLGSDLTNTRSVSLPFQHLLSLVDVLDDVSELGELTANPLGCAAGEAFWVGIGAQRGCCGAIGREQSSTALLRDLRPRVVENSRAWLLWVFLAS